jgi:NAD+ diphosphatase
MRFCPRRAAPLGQVDVGGASRVACSDAACGYVHWDNHNPILVVAAIVEHAGRVVLARNRGLEVNFL